METTIRQKKNGTVAAIIAEYNPFHNGHAWHIARTRALTGAETVVVIMNGNFVQRGEPAICDKFSRTRMALAGGADLVLELPLPFACATAETFARGGVGVADALGCVDVLSFGTECGDLTRLSAAADAVDDEALRPSLESLLAQGKSFAAARTEAVRGLYGDDTAELLCLPNNTLAVEYLRALRRLDSSIRPIGIQREGVMHDSHATAGEFASATALRRMLREGNVEETAIFMPPAAHSLLLSEAASGRTPAAFARCERAVLARLRSMSREQFAALPDISEGLENRLYEAVRTADSLEALYTAVKCKRYSHARVRRLVLSAFLGLRAAHASRLPYLRLLGMNARGRALLSAAKPSLPLLSSFRQVQTLPPDAQNIYRLECHADDLWALMPPAVLPCGADMTTKLIVTE